MRRVFLWAHRITSAGKGHLVIALALTLVIYFLLAYATYAVFTSQVPSGNDFYSRWSGTRALLLEGKDPYSEEVTLEIQRGMYGRPARGDEDQVAFAYPLYVSLFILPLAFLPYPQAQALWLSGLVFLTLATVIITLTTFNGKPSPIGLLALSLWCLLFYPMARSIVLGQFTVVVLTFAALSLWSMQRGRDFLAGCSLALATIKPQMVFLLIPFLLLWALLWRRYRILGGFLTAMGVLLLLPSFLLPTWIPSFLIGLNKYQTYTSAYTGGRSPLRIFFDFSLPSSLSFGATLLISLLLGGYMIYEWVQALREREDIFQTIFLTIIITLLLPVQTGTTNQVLLLPLFLLLFQGLRQRYNLAPLFTLLLQAILLLGPWMLFILTLGPAKADQLGRLEHPIMFVCLPMAALIAFLVTRRGWLSSSAIGGCSIERLPSSAPPNPHHNRR